MKSLEQDLVDEPFLRKNESYKSKENCCVSCLKAIFCCCLRRQDLTSRVLLLLIQ